MIVFELDIPSLNEQGIRLNGDPFCCMNELDSSSMFDWTANDWDADSLDRFIRQKKEEVSEGIDDLVCELWWIKRTINEGSKH